MVSVAVTGSGSWRRLLPGVEQFRGYRRRWLRGDLLAGVTVAAYLIPQVMAYAKIAGLPPVVGLWTAIGPLAIYAVLGSSRQLSVGPESTTALLTATALAPLAAGDTGRYAALAAMLALLVGGLCLLGGFIRLGVLADLLSRPVLALATTLSVLTLGVLYGVLVAIGLSILDLLRRMARPHAAVLGYLPGVPGMHDIGETRRCASPTPRTSAIVRWPRPNRVRNGSCSTRRPPSRST